MITISSSKYEYLGTDQKYLYVFKRLGCTEYLKVCEARYVINDYVYYFDKHPKFDDNLLDDGLIQPDFNFKRVRSLQNAHRLPIQRKVPR